MYLFTGLLNWYQLPQREILVHSYMISNLLNGSKSHPDVEALSIQLAHDKISLGDSM